MIKISFTPEFLQWVALQMRANDTGLDARQFAGEFFQRAFVGRGAEVAAAALMLLKALEMVQQRLEEKPGGVVAFSGEEWTQIDKAIAAAKGAG